MNVHLYHLLHVGGVILLAAFTFQAFGAAAAGKAKGGGLVTGVLSILVLVAGVGLLHELGLAFT